MLWKSLNYFIRFMRAQYRVFAERMLDGKMSVWHRVRVFFMFVGLLTLLGVIAIFSLVAFVIFGIIAMILTASLVLWSWFYRLLYPGAMQEDPLTPRIFMWHMDFGRNEDTEERDALEDEEIYDVHSAPVEEQGNDKPPSS